jgi:hypothetical protein
MSDKPDTTLSDIEDKVEAILLKLNIDKEELELLKSEVRRIKREASQRQQSGLNVVLKDWQTATKESRNGPESFFVKIGFFKYILKKQSTLHCLLSTGNICVPL